MNFEPVQSMPGAAGIRTRVTLGSEAHSLGQVEPKVVGLLGQMIKGTLGRAVAVTLLVSAKEALALGRPASELGDDVVKGEFVHLLLVCGAHRSVVQFYLSDVCSQVCF